MANGHATITNRLGLHARPAMSFVQLANTFSARVLVRRADSTEWVDGKSIMQMLLLAATQETVLEVNCEGADDEEALAGILRLISAGFDEE